jgi:hypothetical protein
MLNRLVGDLQNVAETGDLSELQEKIESAKASAPAPFGGMGRGPSGMSGAAGASAKGMEAVASSGDLSTMEAKLEHGKLNSLKSTGVSSNRGAELLSKLQNSFESKLKESDGTETVQTADSISGSVEETSGDTLDDLIAIQKISLSNKLTNQLRIVYLQDQTLPSSLSLSA